MLATTGPVARVSPNAIVGTQDLASSPEAAFALICEVEKWPVWLSFARTARRIDESLPLQLGSDVALRGAIPGEEEELYEVDRFLDGHIVSLVGAYSVRRRIDFRIERKSEYAKLVARLEYPSYGGALGALIDRMTARRRLEAALEESLIHFKGLVEFKETTADAVLSDF
jgi:hypothetical protein